MCMLVCLKFPPLPVFTNMLLNFKCSSSYLSPFKREI